MSKFLGGFLIALCSVNLGGEPFIISELFGSRGGRAHDLGNGWIELANLSKGIIVVNSIELEITEGKSEKLIFAKNISLTMPILFNDYLLIAEERNLGLSQCLRDESAIVVIPGFSSAHDHDRKICIVINNQQKSCVKINKKVKMLDNTSLFRDLSDLNEEPLWRNEPCHLVDNIFAGPGLPARFCSTNLREGPFQRCDYLQDVKVYQAPIDARKSLKIAADQMRIMSNDNQTITVSVEEGVVDGILFGSLCAHPDDSQKICHLLVDDRYVQPLKSQAFSFAYAQKNMGDKLSLKMDVPAGLVASFDIIDGQYQDTVTWKMALPQYVLTDQSMAINLDIKADEVPLNFALLARNGQIIWQRSFVNPGKKAIEIPLVKDSAPAAISLSGKKGNLGFSLTAE